MILFLSTAGYARMAAVSFEMDNGERIMGSNLYS
jgi:hypothetical protein